ncbi:GGDEF domain-containing protein, partial [Actinotalea sp. C106]|uniref:GGDEF domain-containing protein n=1 Tax=Actinotalea sp. C106 TaxID=2908644 RepID=UPI0020277B4C
MDPVRQAESSEPRRAGAEADRDHQAHHDALTGLLNRAGLLAQVSRLLAEGPTAAAVINLDHFRAVNDSLGHAAGDELLKVIASRLQAAVGHGAVVARTSADEFAVAQTAVDGSDDAALPDALLGAVAMPYRVAGVEVVTTASSGVPLAQDAQRSAEELLRRAGAA